MVERDDERPVPASFEDDPDAPATPDEVAASQRLRDALEGRLPAGELASLDPATASDLVLAQALRAAWEPGSLAPDESQAVLDATPSASEQRLAAVLRDALASPDARADATPHAASDADRAAAGIDLALSLRAAFAPRDLPAAEHQRIVDAALAKMPASAPAKVVPLAARRSNVVRVAFGAAAVGLALAASVVLAVTQAPLRGGSEAPLALAKARTTQPLFNEPFKPGETSARIDRIASARASDFRDNRFATWGVR